MVYMLARSLHDLRHRPQAMAAKLLLDLGNQGTAVQGGVPQVLLAPPHHFVPSGTGTVLGS